MKKRVLNIIILLMIISAFAFIFSGCEIIQQFLGGNNGGGGEEDNGETIPSDAKHIIANWDFDDQGSYDYDTILTSDYANFPDGRIDFDDNIIGWMDYEIDGSRGIRLFNSTTTVADFRVDIGNFPPFIINDDGADNPFLRLYQYISTSDTVETDLRQFIYYPVSSNSKFRTKIKFIDFDGGGADNPFLYIEIVINGQSYVLVAASPDGYSGSGWNYENIVATDYNNWYYFQRDLSGLTVSTPPGVWYAGEPSYYTIQNGDVIESINIILCTSNSDVYIDYVDIYED